MEKNGGSRLLQMQARFQQKQLQEREQKIASLYESQQARALDRVRHSPSNGVSSSPPTLPSPQTHTQPGKVRQMFEERRTKGIDKSYPLHPIQNTERTNGHPRKTIPNGFNKVTAKTTEKKVQKTHATSTHSVKKLNTTTKIHKVDNIVNGSGDLNHNHEVDLNTETNKHTPHSNGEIIQRDERDSNDNTELIENETFPEALAPEQSPRTTRAEPGTVYKSPVTRPRSPVKSKPSPTVTAPRRVISENKVSERENSRPRGAMQRAAHSVLKKPTTASPQSSSKSRSSGAERSSEGACSVCGRHFAADRLARHQDICRKTHTKKRKPYDVLKHRLAGTDAENYKGTEAEPFITRLRKAPTSSSTTKVQKPLNSTWRQKHEEFIQAIRAAKQVQAHLNAGGKLSDLPPPPPSENPDYVQCPHCKRRFNQGAAERHIPKCANFQFNKKQPAKRRS